MLDAQAGVNASTSVQAGVISLSVHEDLAAIESLWRGFETSADCTFFQSFAWHDTWQRQIGEPRGTVPAVVVGRAHGRVAFILPLAVERGLVRSLVWHAFDLCDYNAPLLAPDFRAAIGEGGFVRLWSEIGEALRAHPRLRHDVVALARMPERVGAQANPLLELAVSRNPSGAYMMPISGTWEEFYHEKRSSATRRHDRSKRKRLAECGDVELVNATDPCVIEKTLDALFAQKEAQFAARGVPNFLARPGVRAFYRAITVDPTLRDVVHVSRLQVGDTIAAANIGFVCRQRYYHVVASYDGGPISRFGPGTTHLHELIGYALQRGCTEFDFTVGDESYKRDWCDGEIRLYDLRTASTARGWIVAHTLVALTRAKRLIKQTPSLWRAVGAGRKAVARLKGDAP